MTYASISAIFATLLGLALGSFMNVCIYRLPLGKSIIWPPSSCPNCGKRIKFYDNIPVLSYLLLLGRCRYCRDPVSWQYPFVETAAGLLSLALFIRYGLSYQYILYFIFTAALVIISFIDLNHKIVPDSISLPGILTGLLASIWFLEIKWQESIIGILAGGAVLYLIAIVYEYVTAREGMGGGDIKLLAMIGAWMGWKSLPLIVFIASLIGIVSALAFLLRTGKGLRTRIPFGPFLSLSTIVHVFFGNEITQWYIGLLKQ